MPAWRTAAARCDRLLLPRALPCVPRRARSDASGVGSSARRGRAWSSIEEAARGCKQQDLHHVRRHARQASAEEFVQTLRDAKRASRPEIPIHAADLRVISKAKNGLPPDASRTRARSGRARCSSMRARSRRSSTPSVSGPSRSRSMRSSAVELGRRVPTARSQGRKHPDRSSRRRLRAMCTALARGGVSHWMSSSATMSGRDRRALGSRRVLQVRSLLDPARSLSAWLGEAPPRAPRGATQPRPKRRKGMTSLHTQKDE